ncbi:MAG: NAD(P)/FAD-dependent oxidoreductase [Pseudomonadota bacterium]
MANSILIVGAGPTGLTAAVELTRLGHDVTIIDKRAGRAQLSRAVGILPASIRILEPSGVASRIQREAVRFSAIAFYHEATELARIPFGTEADGSDTILGLPQDRTEAHLSDALKELGVAVSYGTAIEAVQQDGAGVTAHFGGTQSRFDYLLGADGVRSTVRQYLNLPYEGFDIPGKWSIADVDAPDWPEPTVFRGFLIPDGNVVIVAPMAPTRFRVVSSTEDALAALPLPMRVEKLHRSGAFTISVRQTPAYGDGRVFLAGDAAHCHSPAGGRGMNLGIADAADFAARLTAGTLEGFSDARHQIGKKTIAFSEEMRSNIMSDSPLRRTLVETGLRVVGNLPPVAHKFAQRFAGEL